MRTSLAAICAFCALLQTPVKAAPILYGIDFTRPAGQLVRVDPATGVAARLGATPSATLGLATFGGNLYTFDQDADRLLQLDLQTGATLATLDIGITGSGEGALAIGADGIGYLSIGLAGNFYRFHLDTGASELIATDLPLIDALEFDASGMLFALQQGSDTTTAKLLTVDTLTGATVQVGDTGLFTTVPPVVGGLSIAPDGELYAALNRSLYRLSRTTGAPALIGPTDLPLSGIQFVDVAEVPEPSSAAAMLLGGALLLYARSLPSRPAR